MSQMSRVHIPNMKISKFVYRIPILDMLDKMDTALMKSMATSIVQTAVQINFKKTVLITQLSYRYTGDRN